MAYGKKKKSKGFNMKNRGNFDFGNKGIFDIKTETKDQSVVEADKSTGKKSIFKNNKKGATVKRDKDGNLIYTTKSGKTFTHTDISEKLIKKTKK
tara:strand:- start:380 stop:664 length:285 start_codon:yes stop_codon:yes gene_type:complete